MDADTELDPSNSLYEALEGIRHMRTVVVPVGEVRLKGLEMPLTLSTWLPTTAKALWLKAMLVQWMNEWPMETEPAPGYVPDGDDAHPGFMFSNFLIDHGQEAVLWSWAIGHIGRKGMPPKDQEIPYWSDNDDQWDPDLHGTQAWEEL
ncbi:hypothetical protein F5146DRAFT_1006742 [Armillaria mellea]|nr:hypothetical protein F5146DRAFT_1006742 [Armillaria mellea]